MDKERLSFVKCAFIDFLLGVVFFGLFLANVGGVSFLSSCVMILTFLFISIGYIINSILLFSCMPQKADFRDRIKIITIFYSKIMSFILIFSLLMFFGSMALFSKALLKDPSGLGFGFFLFVTPTLVILYFNTVVIRTLSEFGLRELMRKKIIIILSFILFLFTFPLEMLQHWESKDGYRQKERQEEKKLEEMEKMLEEKIEQMRKAGKTKKEIEKSEETLRMIRDMRRLRSNRK